MTDTFDPFTPSPPPASGGQAPVHPPAAGNGRKKRGPKPGSKRVGEPRSKPRNVVARKPRDATAVADTLAQHDDLTTFLFVMGHLQALSKPSRTRILDALTKVFG